MLQRIQMAGGKNIVLKEAGHKTLRRETQKKRVCYKYLTRDIEHPSKKRGPRG